MYSILCNKYQYSPNCVRVITWGNPCKVMLYLNRAGQTWAYSLHHREGILTTRRAKKRQSSKSCDCERRDVSGTWIFVHFKVLSSCKKRRQVLFQFSSFMRMRLANFDNNLCVTQLQIIPRPPRGIGLTVTEQTCTLYSPQTDPTVTQQLLQSPNSSITF